MKEKFKTIVGGRSNSDTNHDLFPRGIEILIKKASCDRKFKKKLLKDPLKAADILSLELNENEKKIITETSKSLLKSMIKKTNIKKRHENAFMTKSASVMLSALLAGDISCDLIDDAKPKGLDSYDKPPDELIDMTISRMQAIQEALENYKDDNDGNYISTTEWYSDNHPLKDYLDLSNLYDSWYRAFHYEGIEQGGKIVNYLLESYGPDGTESGDDISCPVDTEQHSWGS
jgi:hypothetical protein